MSPAELVALSGVVLLLGTYIMLKTMGAASRPIYTLTYATDNTAQNIRTVVTALYGTPSEPCIVVVRVASGVKLGGLGGGPALRFGVGWNANSSFELNIDGGSIFGQGGNGGSGSSGSGIPGGDGSAGGDAIHLDGRSVLIRNSGFIVAGQGGGGGGGFGSLAGYGGGGGGGRGYIGGSGGGAGGAGATAGGNATHSTSGGSGSPNTLGGYGGVGGVGGQPGTLSVGGAAGAEGLAVKTGGGVVTWSPMGSVTGLVAP